MTWKPPVPISPRMGRYWVASFLWAAGFMPATTADKHFVDLIQPALDEGIWQDVEDAMPRRLRDSGFEVTGDLADLVVRYKGPAMFEKAFLANYGQVLTWCVYNVEEVDDPDRGGRKMLKILPPLEIGGLFT